MPKTSTDFWLERVPDDIAYEEAVRRWGNLTLLLARLNSSISNGDWDAKRTGNATNKGYSDSAVLLTRQLVDLSEWNYASIAARSSWLAIAATLVWTTDAPPVTLQPLASFVETASDETVSQ